MDDPGTHQIKAHGPHGKDLGYGNRGCLKSYGKHKLMDYNSCGFLLTDNISYRYTENLTMSSNGITEVLSGHLLAYIL